MSDIVAKHKSSDSNARKWGNMLAGPQDVLVRAPSSTPFLASKTRFVKTLEIPYAKTAAGSFSVAMFPNALSCLAYTTAPHPIPPLAPGEITLTNLGDHCSAEDSAFIDTGLLQVSGVAGENLGTVGFQDLSVLDAGLAGDKGIVITQTAGATMNQVVKVPNASSKYYLRMVKYTILAGVWTRNYSAIYNLSSGAATWSGVDAAQVRAVAYQVVTSTGALVPDNSLTCQISINSTSAQIPVSASSQTFDLIKSELLSVGKVGNQRCTSMSLLATSLSPKLSSGGEGVAARCRIGTLATPGGTVGLMDAIKKLPEQRYWRSGNLNEGGYAWWLPDDLESYEPRPIQDVPASENVLVFCGNMSDAQGYIRIIATWTFEFYTPSQLFSRDYNMSYSQAHRDMFDMLAQQPAVSANAGHLALLAAVAGLATTVYDFYTKNQKFIDGSIASGIRLGRQLVGAQPKVAKARQEQVARSQLPPKAKKGQSPDAAKKARQEAYKLRARAKRQAPPPA